MTANMPEWTDADFAITYDENGHMNLPRFLDRKVNGITSEMHPSLSGGRRRTPAVPKIGKTKRLKRGVEYREVYLIGKRGFPDGYNTATLVKRSKKYARLLIGEKTAIVPVEVWDGAMPKVSG